MHDAHSTTCPNDANDMSFSSVESRWKGHRLRTGTRLLRHDGWTADSVLTVSPWPTESTVCQGSINP